MAATKYQVLYRFMNETLDTPVTNNATTTYDPTFEFYTDPDHRIFSSNAKEQNEELDIQQEMITYANSSSNQKHDMLFVFNGTKKILHKKWIPDQTGYIVRDWQAITRSKIGNRGDYSKDFITLNEYSPEDGGQVVCTLEVFNKYFPKSGEILITDHGDYSSEELQQMLLDTCYWQLKDPEWEFHATPYTSPYTTYYSSRWINAYPSGYHAYDYPLKNIFPFIDGKTNVNGYSKSPIKVDESRESSTFEAWVGHATSTTPSTYTDYLDNSKMYSKIFVTKTDVETTTIPGHYEDSSDAPYAIMDQYKRIESSPWIINCTVGSFEAALVKAKILVGMIGIENVKIIKVVPIDQFIKIV